MPFSFTVAELENKEMAAVTLSRTSLFVSLFMLVSADQKIITAQPGKNVTLPCRAPNNKTINIVEWSRDNLSQHVLVHRDEQFIPQEQHPSFKNRVDLQDRQMKDGDVSLILKNVTTNDAGAYKCRILMNETQSWELTIIDLSVDPPGPPGGHTDGGKEDGFSTVHPGLIASLSVPAVLIIIVLVVLIYRKYKQQKSQNLYEPPAELQPV